MSKPIISKPKRTAASSKAAARYAHPLYVAGARFYRDDDRGGYEFAVVLDVRPKTYRMQTVSASTNGRVPTNEDSAVPLRPDWDQIDSGFAPSIFVAKEHPFLKKCLFSGRKGHGGKYWYRHNPGQKYYERLWWTES